MSFDTDMLVMGVRPLSRTPPAEPGPAPCDVASRGRDISPMLVRGLGNVVVFNVED